MLSQELQDLLRDIAFSPDAKPANRVLACGTLHKCSPVDDERIMQVLSDVATDSRTVDFIKVKALALLDRINDTCSTEELTAEEADSLRTRLTEEYLGVEEERPVESTREATE